MVQFISENTGRVFTIYDNNYTLFKQLLALDVESNARNILDQSNYLSSNDIQEIVNTLNIVMNNNSLYEFNNNDSIEIVANPSEDQLNRDDINVVPLHPKRHNFLNLLTEFLRSSDSIEIT